MQQLLEVETLDVQQSLSSQQVVQQSQQFVEQAVEQVLPLLQQLSAWIIPPKPTAIKAARNIERVDFIEILLFRSADEFIRYRTHDTRQCAYVLWDQIIDGTLLSGLSSFRLVDALAPITNAILQIRYTLDQSVTHFNNYE